jgi:hypothetical protein
MEKETTEQALARYMDRYDEQTDRLCTCNNHREWAVKWLKMLLEEREDIDLIKAKIKKLLPAIDKNIAYYSTGCLDRLYPLSEGFPLSIGGLQLPVY